MPLRVCIEAAHNPAAAGSLVQIQPPQPNFLAARGPVRKVQRRSIERIAIQSSSVVERSAVNRLVVGSNPTSGAISCSGFTFFKIQTANSTSVTPMICNSYRYNTMNQYTLLTITTQQFRGPWKSSMLKNFLSRSAALDREKALKSAQGRAWLKARLGC